MECFISHLVSGTQTLKRGKSSKQKIQPFILEQGDNGIFVNENHFHGCFDLKLKDSIDPHPTVLKFRMIVFVCMSITLKTTRMKITLVYNNGCRLRWDAC